MIEFRCNVCGSECSCEPEAIGREQASCNGCGSTVRMRAIVHHVSESLFGTSLALPDFPLRKDLHGVGLSDWQGYARRFAERVDYLNTYYHQEPQLDITRVPEHWLGRFDFLISSDVFEHVCPPVSLAFEGARKLLKPGGTLVLTVPFATETEATVEHFPELHEFRLEAAADGASRLVNRRRDGVEETFDNLVFHGGPGPTLEMRLFARAALERDLAAAGFSDIRFASDPVPEFGIHWHHPWSVPVTARA
jgi:SAM-dependent methyltransferase